MHGLWLPEGMARSRPLPVAWRKVPGMRKASASRLRGRPVVMIPGGDAAAAPGLARCLARRRDAQAFGPGSGRAAVVLARPVPLIECRASTTVGSLHLPVPAAARLAPTRTAFLPVAASPAGVINLLRGNSPPAHPSAVPLMTATFRHHACPSQHHPHR